MKSILAAHAAGAGPGALATVVRVQGSAYRRPGARFYLAADGATAGSLSSGCLEDEVAELGRRVLATGQAELVTFDLRPRFGCAGTIDVLIERIEPASPFFAALAEVLATRRARTVGVGFRGDPTRWGSRPEAAESEDLHDLILPPVQLVLVGDSLDSTALAAQARLLGWDVVLAETASELPVLDARTAVVVKAHKLGRDFAALRALLGSPAFYLGLVGPARRRRELIGLLYDDGALAPGTPLPQVFGPSGLDIGGETPAEVALSICAEIQAVLGGHAGGPLRLKPAGIHQRHAPAG
ncbi:MAG: XdhC family protein [Verrucomicrobia bacterium]|nr:XdhC family protein [Verrucomicrobiota bacterium]